MTDFVIGGDVKKGDPIGYTTDLGSGHFDKYGPHCHTFSTPNIDTSDATVGATTSFEMPEINELAKIYLDFTEIVLNEMECRLDGSLSK